MKKSDVYAAAVAPPETGAAAPVALSERPPWLVWVFASIVWLGLLAGVVFLGGFLLVSLVITPLTQPMASAGDTFMTTVKAGDYAQAYQLCTRELEQQVGSVDGLAKMFQGNQPAQWDWSERSIRNGVGYLDGSLTFADGRKGTVHLTLRQVGDDWKLTSFRMNPTTSPAF